MENFLTQNFYISEHPINDVPDKLQNRYIDGLAEFMHMVSDGDVYAKFTVDRWITAILKGEHRAINWQSTHDLSRAKGALGTKTCGLTVYNMSSQFIYDCLYLSEILPKSYYSKALETLTQICGHFDRQRLKSINNHFYSGSSLSLIPQSVQQHRRSNMAIRDKKCKRILVVATVSAGKSTLINAFIGHKLNKTSSMACTSRLSYIYNSPTDNGVTIIREDQSIDFADSPQSLGDSSFVHASLRFNSTLNDTKICLIDTPGSNNSRDLQHGLITHAAIESNDYEAILFVSNSNYLAVNDEVELLDFTLDNTDKPIIMALNQLDKFDPDDDSISEAIKVAESLFTERGRTAIVVPTSALAALLAKVPESDLNIMERCEIGRLNQQIGNPFYELPTYFKNRKWPHQPGLLYNSGILELEYILSIV